jgi:acetolactate synthase-1/2/3 large subunit
LKLTGGELITRMLRAEGVGSVFAVAGASHTHVLDPLDRAGVRIVSSRHEAGAVGAADGYARISGKPGVALIVADQGLPNAIGALAVAWQALSPVVVLVATPPRVFAEADSAVDQDRLALVTPLSKWARTVPTAARLADYLATALKHARSGRTGPVVLLIPEDQLQAGVSPPAGWSHPRPAAPRPDPQAIAEAAEMIAMARRPIIVAGAGATASSQAAAIGELARQYCIPVLMNSMGRGLVPEDHELGFSWPYAQPAACEADLVLLVGARLTQRLGLGLPPRFAASARFIQVDIETTAFHRNRPVTLPVLGDAGAVFAALAAELERRLGERRFDSAWLHQALVPRQQRLAELASQHNVQLHPVQLGQALEARRPEGGILVADGADIATWLYASSRVRRPRGFLDHYPMGAMGSCTALAVGAAAAEHERLGPDAAPVVLVTGDGALGFHPMELHAAVQAGLNLVVVVGNDGAWGTELHGQQAAIGRDINTQLGQLAYEQLAEVIGATGIRIERPEQLQSGLDAAFTAGGVVIVNALIDPQAGSELKTNPDVRMILFSDILSGQEDLQSQTGALVEAGPGRDARTTDPQTQSDTEIQAERRDT